MINVSTKGDIHTVQLKTYLYLLKEYLADEFMEVEWFEVWRDIDPRHVKSIRAVTDPNLPSRSLIHTFYLENIPVDMDVLDLRDLLVEFGGEFEVEKE